MKKIKGVPYDTIDGMLVIYPKGKKPVILDLNEEDEYSLAYYYINKEKLHK